MASTLANIVVYLSLFFGGILIGENIHSNRIDAKLVQLNNLVVEVKEKNNQFLTNFSTLYSTYCKKDGSFTDVDEKLMDMWMD